MSDALPSGAPRRVRGIADDRHRDHLAVTSPVRGQGSEAGKAPPTLFPAMRDVKRRSGSTTSSEFHSKGPKSGRARTVTRAHLVIARALWGGSRKAPRDCVIRSRRSAESVLAASASRRLAGGNKGSWVEVPVIMEQRVCRGQSRRSTWRGARRRVARRLARTAGVRGAGFSRGASGRDRRERPGPGSRRATRLPAPRP